MINNSLHLHLHIPKIKRIFMDQADAIPFLSQFQSRTPSARGQIPRSSGEDSEQSLNRLMGRCFNLWLFKERILFLNIKIQLWERRWHLTPSMQPSKYNITLYNVANIYGQGILFSLIACSSQLTNGKRKNLTSVKTFK